MRMLIVGGSGFIGRYLVPRLVEAGHEVAIVRRSGSTAALPADVHLIAADRTRLTERAAALRAFRADVVVDLILSSGRQAVTLMDVFRGSARRVIVISSMDVYRANSILHRLEHGPLEPGPLGEDASLRTVRETYSPEQIEALRSVYGWLDDAYDKVAVERAVQGDVELPATVLRLPMTHGPGDWGHRFLALLRRMDDRRPVIPMPASVAAWRAPREYVENVAAAIALAATSDRAAGRVYNAGADATFTELEWARAVGEAAGWRGEIVVVADDDAPASLRIAGRLEQHLMVDSSRIRAELGFVSLVSREEGLRRTVEWERAHPSPVDPASFDYAAEDAAVARARVSRAAVRAG